MLNHPDFPQTEPSPEKQKKIWELVGIYPERGTWREGLQLLHPLLPGDLPPGPGKAASRPPGRISAACASQTPLPLEMILQFHMQIIHVNIHNELWVTCTPS